MESVSFTDKTVMYDGLEKTLEVENAPVGATITYTPKNTYTDIGAYQIVAVVSYDGTSIALSATLTIVQSTVYASSTQIEEMIAKLQTAVEEKNTLLTTAIAELEKQHGERLDKLTAEQEENQQALVLLTAAYTAKVEELTKADADNKAALESKIAQEAAALQGAIDDLTAAYEESVEALEQADADNKAALEAKIAEEKNALDKKIKDLTDDYNATVAELERDYQAADTEIKNDLAKLKTDTDSKIGELNTKITTVEQKIVAAQTAFAEQIATLKNETNAKIAALEATITQLKETDTSAADRLTELEKTVAALLEKTYYTVSFVTGTDATIPDQKVEKYGKATAPATPVRDGYVLLGWYLGEDAWSFGGDSVTTNMTLSAVWAEIDNSTKELAFYPLPDGTYGVMGGNALYLETVVIPATYNGKAVTAILDNAFYGAVNLKEILIPDSVKSIGSGAFENCPGLTSITLPESVTSIGDSAFRGCGGLASITIPDSVRSIGSDVFGNCDRLKSVTAPVSVFSSLDADNYITTLVVSSGSYIPADMFKNWTRLKDVTIANSVTSIEEGAFEGCTSLESLTIPFVGQRVDGVGNTRLAYIFGNKIPASLKKIVVTGETMIGDYAFEGCAQVTSIALGDGVTEISRNLPFFGVMNLTEFSIGTGMSKIGSIGFDKALLTKITVAEGNNTYHSKNNCLIETQSKTLIVGCNSSIIPTDGSVTSIGESAFSGCTGLTEITIPAGVTSIGSYAFIRCTGLTEITLPESVTSIGGYAFQDCTGLTEITIPASVTSIENYAFSGCGLDGDHDSRRRHEYWKLRVQRLHGLDGDHDSRKCHEH